jgi:hypothetical protein
MNTGLRFKNSPKAKKNNGKWINADEALIRN